MEETLGQTVARDVKESEMQRLSRLIDEQNKLLHNLEDRLGFVTSPEPREARDAPIQESMHITVLNERLQTNNERLQTNNDFIKYLRNILVV